MKENVGTVDRIGRSIAGPALIAIGYEMLNGKKGKPLGLLTMMGGIAVAESAITRVCPLNEMVGLDTREPELIRSDLKAELDPKRLADLLPGRT